ncbi:MAG: CHAT domain-containing protein [Planctomycetota bacterium]
MPTCRPRLSRAILALLLCATTLTPSVPAPSLGDVPTEEERTQLRDTANALAKAGKFADALTAFRVAQQAYFDAGDTMNALAFYSWIASCQRRLGKLEEAVATYREAHEQLQSCDGPAKFVAEKSMWADHKAADILRRLGRPAESLAHCENAVRIATQLPLSLTKQAAAYYQLGVAQDAQQRPTDAAASYQQSLALLPANSPRRRTVRSQLANCMLLLGNGDEALATLNEVLAKRDEITAKNYDFWADTLQRRAAALRMLRRYDAALAALEESLALRAPHEADPNLSVAVLWLDVALVQLRLQRPREALTAGHKARAIIDPLLPGDHRYKVRLLMIEAAGNRDLHGSDQDDSRLERSRQRFEQAVAMGRRLPSYENFAPLASLADLMLHHLSDPQAAATLYRESINGVETQRAGATALDATERANYFQRLRSDPRWDPYEGFARAMLRLGKPEAAFEQLELARARGVLDLLDSNRIDPIDVLRTRAQRGNDGATLSKIDQVVSRCEAALRMLRKLRGTNSDPAAVTQAQAELRNAQRARAELVKDVIETATPAAPREIRRMLRTDERLLFFLLGERESFVLLIGPDGDSGGDASPALTQLAQLQLPDGSALTAEHAETMVHHYLDQLTRDVGVTRGLDLRIPRNMSQAKSEQLGHELFQCLLPATIWKELESCSLVYLVPHQALHLLPFESLVVKPDDDAASTRFWIDMGPMVTYGTSGSVFEWCHRRRQEQRAMDLPNSVLVLADPDYTTPVRPDASTPPNLGATIRAVDRGSDAARVGLQVGDVIVRCNGVEPRHRTDLKVLPHGESSQLVLQVWRAGTTLQVQLPVANGAGEELAGLRLGFDSPATELQRLMVGVTHETLELEPLPGARREAASIATAIASLDDGPVAAKTQVKQLIGDAATESALFTQAQQARVLHIATHQIPDKLGRWGAGRIALTRPAIPTLADDGYLDLDDLILHWRTRLLQCELVVLSACRSRLGMLQGDEGLFALPLGLQYAGCPTVIASLWPVNDTTTATLMSGLYAGLTPGAHEARLTAFRDARRQLRAKHPEPYYWAPFVWIGAPR